MPIRTGYAAKMASPRIPWRLLIHITGESHTTVGMEVKDKIVIGRADSEGEAALDLDLIPYGAAGRGVSRRHIQIVRDEDSLFVEDLNSTNHTLLNGYVLDSRQRYRLHDGDELALGLMRLVVRFVKSPPATALEN
jgi:pSer/pThr/pTyr-binding forkhead associated (FHA) protein